MNVPLMNSVPLAKLFPQRRSANAVIWRVGLGLICAALVIYNPLCDITYGMAYYF